LEDTLIEQLGLFTETLYRSDVRPLDQAHDIYHALDILPVGSPVPHNVLINDYDDLEIPPWLVQEREVCEAGVRILTIIDTSTMKVNVFGEKNALAHEIFIAPTKILSGVLYLWSSGCDKRRDKFGDIRQNARQFNERHTGK
jgi:hypothetical protein